MEPNSAAEPVLEGQAASSDLEAAPSENLQATGTMEPNLTAKPVSGDQDALDEAVQATRTMALNPIAKQVLDGQFALGQALQNYNYVGGQVSHFYNPYGYAQDPYRNYVNMYCKQTKKVLFLGMNPGPNGMMQNGVPFGDMHHVNWLGIGGDVNQPATVHPMQPINGFGHTSEEISGKKLWEFFKSLCGTPEAFFQNCFVNNYCPLIFLDEGGRNVPLDKLPKATRDLFEPRCDLALLNLIKAINADLVVGIGNYAYTAAKRTLENAGITNISLVLMRHPAAPGYSEDKWKNEVKQQLIDGRVYPYLTNPNY